MHHSIERRWGERSKMGSKVERERGKKKERREVGREERRRR